MKFNIAIDGPSAAGKSTIAKKLAEKLHYIHLDTGAMYRCIAYKTKLLGIDIHDETRIKAFLPNTTISFDSYGNVFLDGVNVSDEIRKEDMSWLASTVSTLLSVREDLVRRQQIYATNKGIIMDGRDIGTVVLPDAEVKLFLTANVKSRALRRYKEHCDHQHVVSLEDIEADIIKRDIQDTTREFSPLIKADDAIVIDTTDMNVDDVINLIQSIIDKKKIEAKIND